jgi:hypothetical protein
MPPWLAVAIVVGGVLIFAPGITAPLTHYDDSLYIYKNQTLTVPGWAGLAGQWDSSRAWRGEFVEFFPLRDSVYWALYQVWGTAGTPYHVTTLSFHLLATFLVFSLMRRIAPTANVAIVTTLLFLVHPIHSESVLWAAALKDPMYTSFMLLSLIAYFNARETRGAAWYALSLLALVASLLVKSMAISTPLLMLALELFVGKRDAGSRIVARVLGPTLICALFLVQFVLIGKANHAVTSPHGGSWASHIVLSSWAQVMYLRQTFFPATFRLIYCFEPPTGLIDWRFFVALGVAAVVGALLFLARKQPLIWLSALWYVACLLPVSNIIPFPAVMADRYLYAASVGACLLIALLLERLRQPFRHVAALGIIVGFGATTFTRSFVWQDEDSLWAEPDADAACILDVEAPAAQSHLLRSWTAKDRATRLLAIERGVATPGLLKLDREHFCEMLAEGAIETSLAGDPRRGRPWALFAVQHCRDRPRTWVAVMLVNLHTNPEIATRAAAKAYRLNPTTELKTMWGLTAIEARHDLGINLVMEAIDEKPEVSCNQVLQWAFEVGPEKAAAARRALDACEAAGYRLSP